MVVAPSIRRTKSGDLGAIARLAASQQIEPERHIAYLGTDADSIATDISELPNWHDTAAVAEDGGVIVGAIVADIDSDMGRVWWLGPFIAIDEWNETADRLYETSRSLIPASITEEEACADSRSMNILDWSQRNQFVANEGSALLTLFRPPVATAPSAGIQTGVRPFEPADHAAVSALHDAAFPGTHTSSGALLESSDPRAVVEIDGTVAGYVAYEVQSDNSGYIDFLAVEPRTRGHGLGAALVRYSSDELFDRGVSHVHLSVRESNKAARELYRKLGFEEERLAIPYRKGFTLDN